MGIIIMTVLIREKEDKFPEDEDKAELIMLDLDVWLSQMPHQDVLEVVKDKDKD